MSRLAVKFLVVGFAVLVACSSRNSPEYDLAQFTSDLREKEIALELTAGANSLVLGRVGTVVSWGDIQIGAFEYPDRPAAEAAVALIADDGSSVEGITEGPISWPATPHFFHKGRLLVLYVGDDRPTADLLKVVLGPQIAGGHGVLDE